MVAVKRLKKAILPGATILVGMIAGLAWLPEFVRPPIQRIERYIQLGPQPLKPSMPPPMMVSNLLILDADDPLAQRLLHSRPRPVYRNLETFRDCERDVCPEMVMLPEGTFSMGSPVDERGRDETEDPQRKVTFSYPFAMAKYETTFEAYDAFAEATHRKKPEDQGWGRGRRPVINVNWHDAVAYCEWLGEGYFLSSEVTWEYAARAGTTTRYSFGDKITEQQANFGRNIGKTTEVGRYASNAWGLYDMHGNVMEWVANWKTDPDVSVGGQRRLALGGAWNSDAENVRVASRHAEPIIVDHFTDLGFRCISTVFPDETHLPSGRWRLVSADPPLPPTKKPVDATFEYSRRFGHVSLSAGCSAMGAYVKAKDEMLEFTNSGTTELFCDDDIAALEDVYFGRIAKSNRAKVVKDQLIIIGEGRLIFERSV